MKQRQWLRNEICIQRAPLHCVELCTRLGWTHTGWRSCGASASRSLPMLWETGHTKKAARNPGTSFPLKIAFLRKSWTLHQGWILLSDAHHWSNSWFLSLVQAQGTLGMGGCCSVTTVAPPASLHDAQAGSTLRCPCPEARMITSVLPMGGKSTVPVSEG